MVYRSISLLNVPCVIAVRHLTAAAAALEPPSGFTSPPATGTHVSVDAMGRTRVQAAASPADRTRLVQDARRVAETSAPGVRGMLVYQVVRAFGDAVKFRGVSVPDEYSELAAMGDLALRYRDHRWKYDPPGGQVVIQRIAGKGGVLANRAVTDSRREFDLGPAWSACSQSRPN